MLSSIIQMGLVLAIPFGIYACTQTDSYQEGEREKVAQKARDAEPHLYKQSPDGCSVYRFKTGDHWQYFTRCLDSSTATVTNRTVCRPAGKSQHCETKSSTIDNKPQKGQ